jgi:uracil-DNA glycosylase family 4
MKESVIIHAGSEYSMPLSDLYKRIASCTRCALSGNRNLVVPGEGPLNAKIMLIGEAPGRDEDLSGRPFVGRAGRLLDECLETAGIKRSEIFITNVVKCRPPDNRRPLRGEMNACNDYLQQQIHFIDPVVICLMGNAATRAVLKREGITSLHGQLFENRYLVTFHPAAIVRNKNLKALLISDLKEAKAIVERQ